MTSADVSNLSARAETGEPEAAFWLALAYADGRLLPKDKARSATLMLQAAEKGYAPAEYRVGLSFYPENLPETEKWMLAAAQHGQPDAQRWLGTAYEFQWLGITDLQEALKWYRKAAEQGQPDAQTVLGMMYEHGTGVPQDYSAAADWYRKAAEHFPDLGGAGQGRNQLGLLYIDGLGVPKDYVQAYLWFSAANNQEDLDYVQSRMNPAQIEEARRLASDWKARHPQTQDPAADAKVSQR
jgi:hypothetical protein